MGKSLTTDRKLQLRLQLQLQPFQQRIAAQRKRNRLDDAAQRDNHRLATIIPELYQKTARGIGDWDPRSNTSCQRLGNRVHRTSSQGKQYVHPGLSSSRRNGYRCRHHHLWTDNPPANSRLSKKHLQQCSLECFVCYFSLSHGPINGNICADPASHFLGFRSGCQYLISPCLNRQDTGGIEHYTTLGSS